MDNRRNMAHRHGRLLIVAGALAGAALTAHGDRVILKSGRVLEGAVVKQNPNEVVLRTEVGTISLNRADIQVITATEMEPEEVDGDTAYGRKEYEAAAKHYAAALQRIGQKPGSGEGQTRLERKLALVQGARQTQSSTVVNDHIRNAQALHAAGRHAEAEKTLETALPYLTSDAQGLAAARRLLAQVRFALATQAADRLDPISQERALRKAVEADGTYYKAHLALGEILMRSAATEKLGLQELLTGLQQGEGALSEEESVKYHYLVARKFYDQGDYAKAATNFIEAVRGKGKYPAYADALDLAAKSYIKLSEANKGGDFRETIDTLNEALRLDPQNADARYLLGTIYLDQGQPDSAIPELEETLTIDKKYPRVHRNMARAYLLKKDYEKSVLHLEEELKSDPNSYEVLVDRAAIYILRAEYEKAEIDLMKAVSTEPTRWNAYLKAAEMAAAREQYDAARASLAKVLSLKPDAVEAYVQMGNILVKQKNYDDARKWYTEVVQYLEKMGGLSLDYRKLMADAQTQLGVIDFEQESPRQAETRFAVALQFMPNHAMALNKVGDVKRRLGEEVKARESKEAASSYFGEAEQYYTRAIQADPLNADLYLSLGILYHQSMKEAAKAAPNYMEYLAKGGRNGEVLKWVEEVGGDTEKAATLLAENDVLTSGAAETAAVAGEPMPAAALALGGAATTATATVGDTTATLPVAALPGATAAVPTTGTATADAPTPPA